MNAFDYSKEWFASEKELKTAIESCDTLCELFDLWKKAQEHEVFSPGEYPDTYPEHPKTKRRVCSIEAFKTSFCPDGFVQGDGQSRKTILFIFRESNISSKDKSECLQSHTDDGFWLRKTCEADKDNMYSKYIAKYSGERFENIACINLNKRGGFGACTMTRLKNYVQAYQDLIRREIEIIAPAVIICGGTYGLVSKIVLKDPGFLEKAYDCYHPCYRKKKEIIISI